MRGRLLLWLTSLLAAVAADMGAHRLARSLGLEGLSRLEEFALAAACVCAAVVVVGLVMRVWWPSTAVSSARHATDSLGGIGRTYDPRKIGNDASARPWERNSMGFDAAAAQAQMAAWGVAGFDAVAFVETAKRNFLSLQAAWDRADLGALRALMTDAMTDELAAQLIEREQQLAGAPNTTEVVVLEARLLGLDDLGADWMASVEFSGLIREQPGQGPNPFREIWSMSKPKDGSTGWLVAGVQALA